MIGCPMFVLHRPLAPLASHIDHIWLGSRGALPHTRERSLPTGRVDIVIPLLQDSVVRFDSVDSSEPHHHRGAVVSGAHDGLAVRGMSGASSVIGVHFKAGGAAAFFGGGLAELRNRTVLLEECWGPMARGLRERLQLEHEISQRIRILADALRSRLSTPWRSDNMVIWALQALEADPSAARVGAVQSASNCSPQQFIRRFEKIVGLTPKRYARVLRFNAMLPRVTRVGPRDWAQLAADGGYFDQSHLIHELQLGPTILMLSDPFPEIGLKAPQDAQDTGSSVHLHVGNADEFAANAVASGATLVSPPTDQFYGERGCRVRDPFGHMWLIGHEIEKVTPQEMQRRYTAMFT
jgi:uncharacterized glyoxalase superfamily protein PhnB